MNQEWFEMADVRKRWLANAVWIPLRARKLIEEIGQSGHIGYRQEFYKVVTLSIPVDAKESAKELDSMNIGISGHHRPYVYSGRYVPCDVYKFSSAGVTGTALVLEPRSNREEIAEWHLHQDFVIAVGLKREKDVWVCPDEDYTEVARLVRDSTGTPCLIEAKAEFLRDYLCARNAALYILSYRDRQEVVENASHIRWEENPKQEISGGDRWEGRVTAIHEGGMPFGEKMAVFHLGRTDVDTEEDVPKFEFPTDDKISRKSWTREYEGRKLFCIQGELWRKEWIDPGEYSPRIRGDKLPANVFFITDASGKNETKATLIDSTRWLWFKPEVMITLAHRRGGALWWTTRDTGGVRCSPDYSVHFGVNRLGLINVFAKDIAQLPDWQQRIWAGLNVSPEGGVSDELLASQMKAMPANTHAPEELLPKVYSHLNEVFKRVFGGPLFREHHQQSEIMKHAHRLRAADQSGLFGLAKDLARLTADSIDTQLLHKIVCPPKEQKWSSLKSLEKVVATVVDSDTAQRVLSPLFGIYELRHADAHLASSQVNEAFKLAAVDPDSISVSQGYQLIDACVSTLDQIANILGK